MTTSKWLDLDFNSQDSAMYKGGIDGDAQILKRFGNAFAPHAQDTPNMTVRLEAGALFVNGTLTEVAAQSTGTITAPSGNPRIDRVVIDGTTGAVSVITGAEAGSPTAPAITTGKIPIAQVLLDNSPVTTSIINSLITDERVISSRLSGTLTNTIYYSVVAQTMTMTIASPCVVTAAAARQVPMLGSPIVFTTSGTLPTGVVSGTTYYVGNISGSTLNLYATRADAMANTNKINTSGSQSGTHTANNPVYQKATNNPSFIEAEVQAGGGGGGGGSASGAGGGGGAGSYAIGKIMASVLGSSETITCGLAGAKGASTNTGSNGSTSSFGSFISCPGGSGGVTSSSTGDGGVGGAAPTGTAVDMGITGTGGVPGNNSSTTNAGVGGASPYGGSGSGKVGSGAGNSAHPNSGSGGTGGGGANAGGDGGSGIVIIREYA
jgi:hypothetical protein